MINPSSILMSHFFGVKHNHPPSTHQPPNSSLVALPPNLRADCKALASTPWLRCKPSWAINCEAQWSPQRLRSNWPQRFTYRKNGGGILERGGEATKMKRNTILDKWNFIFHQPIVFFQIRGPISLPKSYLLGVFGREFGREIIWAAKL